MPLYTIGYGNRTIKEFIELLQFYKIDYLVDVRSKPFSNYQENFNKNELKHYLTEANIRYVFMGDDLGGLPKDGSCYTEGKVDYFIVEKKEFYNKGIKRIKTAYYKNITLAVMCSELKPQDCHRSKLIGRTLEQDNIKINHIDESGLIKSQVDVINIATKGLGEKNLFGDSNLYSRNRYKYGED